LSGRGLHGTAKLPTARYEGPEMNDSADQDHEAAAQSRTGRSGLTRGAMWNTLGQGIPIAAGIVAMPFLVAGLGTERFGLLSLAWVLIGYFGMFDLGLGRALTHAVADRLGRDETHEIATTIVTALLLMLMIGLVTTVVLVPLTPWIVHRGLAMPPDLEHETLVSMYLIAAVVPLVTVGSGLRGVLEAHLRFGWVNVVRAPLGILTFVGPLAALPFTDSLVPAVAILVVSRMLGAFGYLWYCLRLVPDLRTRFRVSREAIGPLFSFGAWMTLSNVISPVMVYFDRFLIGAWISVAAVAYYSAPYDAVTRLWLLSSAICTVLFPAFATSAAVGTEHARDLFERSANYMLAVTFPIVLIGAMFAPELLRFWLGPEFEDNGTVVLRILCVGVMTNCLAQVAFALVQGFGRADLTAKLHLAEFPLYMGGLILAVLSQSIDGVALVWTIRVTADAILLFWVGHRLLGGHSPGLPVLALTVVALVGVMCLGMTLTALIPRVVFTLITLAGFTGFSWWFLISDEDRRTFRRLAGLSAKR
jgi:O-antigen/teichoic acid export membrane protein